MVSLHDCLYFQLMYGMHNIESNSISNGGTCNQYSILFTPKTNWSNEDLIVDLKTGNILQKDDLIPACQPVRMC